MSMWSLRLLSDPYTDVEMPLDNGEHILGSDEDADLVISGTTILPRHLCLHVTEDTAELSVLSAAVSSGEAIYINGNAIEMAEGAAEHRFPLHTGDVVTVGSFSFTLGTEDTDLSTIVVPDLIEPSVAEAVADEDTEAEINEAVDQNQPESSPVEAAVPAIESTDHPEKHAFPGLRLKRRSVQLYSLATASVLALAVFIIPWTSSPDAHAKIMDAKVIDAIGLIENITPEQIIAHIEEELELANLHVNTDVELKSWVIEGYVDNAQQSRNLNAWLAERYPELSTNITVSSNLLMGARATLEALGYGHIDVQVDEQAEGGVLALRGHVDDPNDWHTVLKQLDIDVSGVTRWEDYVGAREQQAQAPEIVVQSVRVGRNASFTTHDGQRYFVGSTFGDGVSVEHIELSHVALRSGNQVFHYSLTTEPEV